MFTVKQVEIDTSQLACVEENQLRNALGLLGQNFLMLDQKKLTKNLKEKFICIGDVNLSRVFPDKVGIKITARQPVATLVALKEKEASLSSLIENIATPAAKLIKDSYLVDNEGVIFSKNTSDADIPRIYAYDLEISLGKKLENNLIDNSLKILERIKTFGINVIEAWISDGVFIVLGDSGTFFRGKIIFDLEGRIDIQLASLQLILAEAKIDLKELEFIDLRFDKPIVRFVPEKNVKR